MLLRHIFLLAVLFPLLLPVVSPASPLDRVREDFRPFSGYVIMPVEGEYLLDLDAANGVQVGDLFAVVREGEKIIHPVTKEVLGALDEVKSVLQVTRIKSGYSYARPVGEAGAAIAPGDVVRRYANLPATFWDYTEGGEGFYADLKAALPELEWPGYEAAQAQRPKNQEQAEAAGAQLYFILRHDALQVRGPDFQVLRTFPAPELTQAATARPEPAVSTATPVPVPVPAVGESVVSWDRSSNGRQGNALVFPDFDTLGNLPRGTVMADFVDVGGRLLMAATDEKDIRVFEVGEKLEEVASGDTRRPGKILSIHWWRPDPQGPLYLAATLSVEMNEAVTSFTGRQAAGAVFRFEENRLVPVREGLNYLLGTFDRDGDGSKETLLGQEFDRDIFFGNVKELRLAGGAIVAREIPYELPRIFTVLGSVFADLTGNGSLETATVRNGVLYIYSGDELLFDVRQQMGGSLSQMDYYANPGLKEAHLSSQALEVQPVVRDLDGDGGLELIAITSEGKLGPGIKKAWLSVFKYREGMFVKGTIGEEVDMPLQGLHLTDQAAYMVVTGPPSLLGKKGRSHLIAFPLK